MAKFVIVNKRPSNLDKDCYVIESPNFLPEIKQCASKRPRSGVTSTHYLRECIAKIGSKYAGESFDAMTDVNISNFRGIPCETDDQAHEVVARILEQSYPAMLDYYVDYHIKKRPYGTKLIYFTGNHSFTGKFYEHGIDKITEKDVPVFLGKKTKKVVGKPAITNEDAKNMV